ncbi:hypothetical protein CCR75_000176 [Bremia lactucae]|uniref:RxLR effector protein n=1 Tax=Bremia lactucae TaxID=4779 RepID=A0A976FNV5_BRELC|nr:hypothetical protein CCR75_000176 [Bremia lactucae]
MVKARWGSVMLMCSLALHAYNEAARVRGESVPHAVNESIKRQESRSHFEERATDDMSFVGPISELAQKAIAEIQSGLNGQIIKNARGNVESIRNSVMKWVRWTKKSASISKSATENDQSKQLFNVFKAHFSEVDRARVIIASLNSGANNSRFQRHMRHMRDFMMEEWNAKPREQVYNMLRLDATHSDFLTSSMLQLFVKFLDKYHHKNYNILRDKLMKAYVDHRQILRDRLTNDTGIGKTLLGIIPPNYWNSPTFYPAILLLEENELAHLSVTELVRSPKLDSWCSFVRDKNGEDPYRILIKKLLDEKFELELATELEAALKQEPPGDFYWKLEQLENALFQRWRDVLNLHSTKIRKFLLLDTVEEKSFFRKPLSWIYLSYINYRGFLVRRTILQKLELSYGGVRQVIDVAKEIDPRIASMVITAYYRRWKTSDEALKDLNLMDINLTKGVLNGRWFAHWIEFVFISEQSVDPIKYVIAFAKKNHSEQKIAVLLQSAIEDAPTIIVKEMVEKILVEYIKQTPTNNVLAGLGLDQAGDNLFSTPNILYWIVGTDHWNEPRPKFDPFRHFYTEDKLLKLSSSASTAANSDAAVKFFADEMIQYLEALSVKRPNKRLRTSAHNP